MGGTQHRQSVSEFEISLRCNSIPIPCSELHHFGNLAKMCCSHNPATDPPNLQEIVEQLCDPVFQLVMGVTGFDGIIYKLCMRQPC